MPIGFDSNFGGGGTGPPAARPPDAGNETARGPDMGGSVQDDIGGWIPLLQPILDAVVVEVWLTANDGRTCPECGPYEGALWDAGIGPMPPVHPNCRCRRVTHHVEWRTRRA